MEQSEKKEASKRHEESRGFDSLSTSTKAKETFWQKIEKFFQHIFQRIKVYLQRMRSEKKKENRCIKQIKKDVEKFRFMSKEEQRENFQETFSLMQNNFIKGGIDNKKCIKHVVHFLKITHTSFLSKEKEQKEEVASDVAAIQKKINEAFHNFKNQLLGIEKSKENEFLNFLDHEKSVEIKESIFRTINILSKCIKTVDELNPSTQDSFSFILVDDKKIENYKKEIDDEIKKTGKIIVDSLREMKKKENVEKLKISSKVFRSKAYQYRWAAGLLLIGSVSVILLAAAWVYFGFFKDEDFFQKISYIQMNKSGLYVYFILNTLLSGKLLFSVIALTGIFYFMRFFSASLHNAIICDQRANTLESFEALYENAGADNKKDTERYLVVEKVLNSATEHLPTGFSKQQSDSGGIASSQLLSLIRGSFTRGGD